MKAIFFLLICFPSLCFAGGHVIGNGGDGLILDHRLYLRDLVEADVEKNPYFGAASDPHLEKKLRLLVWDQEKLPVEMKLLARKLTDLEKISPNLGEYVLEAILHYTWSPVSAPLETIPDPEIVLKTPENLLQIANRLDTNIRIHRQSWLEMSVENRVALILHEALYSLLKPLCGFDQKLQEQSCLQSARKARSLTGELFTASTFERSPMKSRDFLPFLDVPTQWIDLSAFRERYWSLEWLAVDSPVESFVLYTEIPLSSDHFLEMVELGCKTFAESSLKNAGRFSVKSNIQPLPYEVNFLTYPTTVQTQTGTELGRQTRLSIQPSMSTNEPPTSLQFHFPASKEDCVRALMPHFRIALERPQFVRTPVRLLNTKKSQ